MDNLLDLLSIHKHSTYLLVTNISENKIRPAKALHLCHINYWRFMTIKEIYLLYFSCMVWWASSPILLWEAGPLKFVWKTNFILFGPLTFLPTNMIISRCLIYHVCSIESTEENIMFILTIPSMYCYWPCLQMIILCLLTHDSLFHYL